MQLPGFSLFKADCDCMLPYKTRGEVICRGGRAKILQLSSYQLRLEPYDGLHLENRQNT